MQKKKKKHEKRKGDELYVIWIVLLATQLIKRYCYIKWVIFQNHLWCNKIWLNATCVDTSELAKKGDLASLKSINDKILMN